MSDFYDNATPKIRLAHISDTHIGYEAYPAIAPNGENERARDVGRAFHQAIDQIVAWDPPLVIHSGDIGERPHLANRWMLFARSELARVAGIRPDGTRRQLVIIAGNHDQPAMRREPCWLELCSDLAGVHVVTGDPRRIRFDQIADADRALDQIEVVAVPHEALKTLTDIDIRSLQPDPIYTSILTAHGVASGNALFRRAIGREFTIPDDLLAAGWDYVALGHWHRRGPIDGPLGSRAWYAGSTENMGFGDLNPNNDARGWYQVTAGGGVLPAVEGVDVNHRPMLRDRVSCSGLDPDEATAKLAEHVSVLRDNGKLDGAIVGVVATGIGRELWNLVDVARIRDTARDAFHFELICQPLAAAETDDTLPERAGGDLWAAIGDRAAVVLEGDSDRNNAAVALARDLLAKELKVSADELEAQAADASGANTGDAADSTDQTGSDDAGADIAEVAA